MYLFIIVFIWLIGFNNSYAQIEKLNVKESGEFVEVWQITNEP